METNKKSGLVEAISNSNLVDLLLNKQQAWTDDLDLAAIDSEFQDYAEKMELIEIINGLQYNHFTTEADSSLAFPTVSDSSPSFVSADQSMSHHLHSYSNGTTYSTPSPPSPLHSLIPDLSLLNQPQIVLETPVLNETSPAHQIITPNSSFSDLNSPQAEPSPISKTEQSKPAASSRIKSSLVQSGRRWADVLASNSSPSPQNPEKNEKAITAAPTPKNENASTRENNTNANANANTNTNTETQKPSLASINPPNFNWNVPFMRCFVIKSFSEDDVHKSIKHNVWASTDYGNKRLDQAFKESASKGPIYLFFSVNASGQFCGMAQMTSAVDYNKKYDLWAGDKWKGQFDVKWIFLKDIPNPVLRHIRLENNEMKSIANSRDTQEVLNPASREVLRIFATYKAKTSILDDFEFYDKRQEEILQKKLAGLSLEGLDHPTGSHRTQKLQENGRKPNTVTKK